MDGVLATLKDIDGVLGSFVVDDAGSVLARDVPAVIDTVALGGASSRVVRLRTALEANGSSCKHWMMRFGNYLLVTRAVDKVTLCVLVSSGANLTALKMGTTLVARRVGGLAAQGRARRSEAPSEPPVASGRSSVPPAQPAVAPSGAPTERPSSPPSRTFRGSRV